MLRLDCQSPDRPITYGAGQGGYGLQWKIVAWRKFKISNMRTSQSRVGLG